MADQKPDGTYPYCPSNGTEGEMFMERFCYRCEKDKDFYTSEGEQVGCAIILDSMLFERNDPKFPPEWISDDNVGLVNPRCTAFEEVTDG